VCALAKGRQSLGAAGVADVLTPVLNTNIHSAAVVETACDALSTICVDSELKCDLKSGMGTESVHHFSFVEENRQLLGEAGISGPLVEVLKTHLQSAGVIERAYLSFRNFIAGNGECRREIAIDGEEFHEEYKLSCGIR